VPTFIDLSVDADFKTDLL